MGFMKDAMAARGGLWIEFSTLLQITGRF